MENETQEILYLYVLYATLSHRSPRFDSEVRQCQLWETSTREWLPLYSQLNGDEEGPAEIGDED